MTKNQIMKIKSMTVVAAVFGLSGILNAEEAKPKGERPSREEIIAKFDKDGDKKLDEEERKAAREARGERAKRGGKDAKEGDKKRGEKGKANHRAEMMKKFDKDGDGELSKEEREAARAGFRAKMVEKFDKDGDGELSAEERGAMRKEMAKRHGKQGKERKRGDEKGPEAE